MKIPDSMTNYAGLNRGILQMTLDQTRPLRGTIFAGFVTDDLCDELRVWYRDLGFKVPYASGAPTQQVLDSLDKALSEDTRHLAPALKNWLFRKGMHESDYSLGLWIEGIGRLWWIGTLPFGGIDESKLSAMYKLYGETVEPVQKAARDVLDALEKEWNPYARGEQFEYNCRVKSDWDREMYLLAREREYDMELGKEFANAMRTHVERNYTQAVHELLDPEEVEALDAQFLDVVEFSGVYDQWPGRLKHYKKALRPFADNLIPGTWPLPWEPPQA